MGPDVELHCARLHSFYLLRAHDAAEPTGCENTGGSAGGAYPHLCIRSARQVRNASVGFRRTACACRRKAAGFSILGANRGGASAPSGTRAMSWKKKSASVLRNWSSRTARFRACALFRKSWRGSPGKQTVDLTLLAFRYCRRSRVAGRGNRCNRRGCNFIREVAFPGPAWNSR